MTRPPRSAYVALLLALVGSLLASDRAEAIPAFARKYALGCNACHTFYPQLNRFGRDFRDNGFRMPDEVEPLLEKPSAPTPPGGTPAATLASHGRANPAPEQEASSAFWSFVPEQIPFSIQAKIHDLINPRGDVTNDVQFDELQLQSGGTFTPRVSYYLHHHLAEEGEPGDLYTGWVRFNNLGGSRWFNVTVGQLELPLTFSPEIERLSSFEYLVYDRELGANRFNLNRPQLGIQVFGQSERGTKLWAGVVNGTGLAQSEVTDSFDSNSFKDLYARLGQEIGEHFVGGYVYAGRARGAIAGRRFNDTFVRIGGDGFFNLQRVIVYGTALYARDTDPLGTGADRSFVGGFFEGDVYLSDRAVILLRFDGVRQKRPAILAAVEGTEGSSTEFQEAAESGVFRVNTVAFTPGMQYLVRPNVKVGFEYQVRQARRDDRAIAQLHFSF